MLTGLLIGFIVGSVVTFIFVQRVIVPGVIRKLEKQGYIAFKK